jgi:diguanylate cyclase (GGDEF)-like protein
VPLQINGLCVALDNLTLLFSLALTSGLMAFSLAITSRKGANDGLQLWALAMACETVAWSFAAMRGVIHEAASVTLTNMALVVAQALKLAAVHQYRGLEAPRWQGVLPVVAMLLMLSQVPASDFRERLIYGSLIYGAQMALIAYALRFDAGDGSRGGRAWWLIYGATVAVLPILALRIIFALVSPPDLTLPPLSNSPNSMQVAVFVGLVALNLLGALGFILLGKERVERDIRELAMHDGLTGIFNRRAFMDRAEQEMAKSLRDHTPLSLLMLDIDHFKRINDQFGHAAGDAVLVEISKLVAKRLRKQDTLGRYGGEEFCILLPETDGTGAQQVAESLRHAIADTVLPLGKAATSVTVSIGISVCQMECAGCPLDLKQILADADRALYQGKSEGRNRTVLLPFSCTNDNADTTFPGSGMLQTGH